MSTLVETTCGRRGSGAISPPDRTMGLPSCVIANPHAAAVAAATGSIDAEISSFTRPGVVLYVLYVVTENGRSATSVGCCSAPSMPAAAGAFGTKTWGSDRALAPGRFTLT